MVGFSHLMLCEINVSIWDLERPEYKALKL